ncbi:MAG: FIG00454279: hypothetical protein [uncultured Caballeronia sp.]|nr:MAG: FIG00454279: hypothetical protein [uncultured Caballeronia sp.]
MRGFLILSMLRTRPTSREHLKKRGAWKDREEHAMKHSKSTRPKPAFHLRGCRVLAPLQQPWGSGCRIVEWIDEQGQISRRVVAADVTEDEVVATIRQHVMGRKHVLDDEHQPRQVLPRR